MFRPSILQNHDIAFSTDLVEAWIYVFQTRRAPSIQILVVRFALPRLLLLARLSPGAAVDEATLGRWVACGCREALFPLELVEFPDGGGRYDAAEA